MTKPTQLAPWTPSTILHLAAKEDVEFAVKACNMHEELVAALEAWRTWFRQGDKAPTYRTELARRRYN